MMNTDKTEDLESPLDQILGDLPQENPPADLQQRCLRALDELAAAQDSSPVPSWYLPLRNVVATATVLVLAVGVFTLFPLFKSAKKVLPPPGARPPSERQLRVAAQPSLPLPPAELEADAITSEIGAAPPAAGAAARTLVMQGDAIDGWVDYRHGLKSDGSALEEAEAGVEPEGRNVAHHDGQAKWVGKDRELVMARQTFPRPGQPPQVPKVEKPWRDLSGERQVIVDKELVLEVKNVEKAYDEAHSIVEKHGGFVASDEISIDAHALDTATLTIRVPSDDFEAAIAELRELGTVIKLVGGSQDVTQEYFSQGAEIRSRADLEQLLVEKYENETNARRKRQLKAQIEQLRREMRREKEILTKLAEETHWPTLQLTLKERGGPASFLAEMLERSGRALAWVGATAIIWVPLVVLLTLFWRRRRLTE